MGKLFQELDEMFATDIVDDDLMVIEDVSSDTTMRLKWSEFQKRIVIENENIADEAVKSHNIDWATLPGFNVLLSSGSSNRSTWSGSSITQIGQSYTYTNPLDTEIKMRVSATFMVQSSNTSAVRLFIQANGVNITNEFYYARTGFETKQIEGTVTIPPGGSVVFRLAGLTSSTAVGTLANANNDDNWITRLIGTIC